MAAAAFGAERVAPTAPCSLQEMMRWPWRNIQRLANEPVMRAHFSYWMERGVIMTTAYSGVGAPEIAARTTERSAIKAQIILASAKGFEFMEACDSKVTAQIALQRHGPPIARSACSATLTDVSRRS